MATLLGGEIAGTHTGVCAPDAEMTAKEIALHGLGRRETASAPRFATHQKLFFNLRKTGPMAAHHASVENGFLRRAWAYPPFSDDFSCGEGGIPRRKVAQWGPWIDTRALYAAVYPGLTSYALGDLVRTFALAPQLTVHAEALCPPTRRKAHCALYDALASALLLLHLGEQEGFESLSIKWLTDHSAASMQTRNERRQQELF